MAKTFLTYATTVILQAIANGYRYGFDIIDISGLAGGTVYPALRRLEDADYLTSAWEKESISRVEPRPARKYYDLTTSGREALADAVKRYRLVEQVPRAKARVSRPSRA
jgi:PadR family transcriptional regulator, regulatory protein PadR